MPRMRPRRTVSHPPFVFPDHQALPEQDWRMAILSSFLWTPHRDVAQLKEIHARISALDPIFYGHLAAWYIKKGALRDHRELFTAHLFASGDQEHREAAYMLLQDFPPYEVARIVDYCKIVIDKRPRILVTAVRDYLRAREADDGFFDRAVLRAREPMKHLYAGLHIKPSPRAQKILFENDPPRASVLHKLKILAKTKDPAQQAKIIQQEKIPFPVAVGAVGRVTASLLISLIGSMSSQELINSMAFLKRRGALKDPELTRVIQEKLDGAKDVERLDAYKAKTAQEAVDLSPEMEDKLEEVRMHQILSRGAITRPTAIFIDKSGSMERAIEAGKRIAALCSGISRGTLHVFLFDQYAYEVTAPGPDLKHWEKAFAPVRAAGSTSIGSPLAVLRKNHVVVEQIIIVSDAEENMPPFFVEEYRGYSAELLNSPSVIVVKVTGGARSRGRNLFEANLVAAGIDYQIFDFQGDYYSLPNLVPLLSLPTRMELLMEVMETPLPRRAARCP